MGGRLSSRVAERWYEAAVLALSVLGFVHLWGSSWSDLGRLPWDAVLGYVGIIAAYCFLVWLRPGLRMDSMWRLLLGFAGGLLTFLLFAHGGFVTWPLRHAAELRTYAFLLYSHFVLVLLIFAAILWSTRGRVNTNYLSFGSSRGIVRFALAGVVAGVWIWAALAVGSAPRSGHIMPFLLIALAKASLTGIGEEVFYRGLLQSEALAYFSAPGAIVLQSAFFTAFHMHLTEVFLPKPLFLLGIFLLGIALGSITRVTSGIGYSSLIHTALDMVIEWRNIC